MEQYQRVLYSGFPRNMGVPSQFTVFGPNHFDRVVRKANRRNTVYCSISRLLPDGPIADKVFFDLDGDLPEHLEEVSEVELFDRMRRDPSFAEDVLGDVVDDMQQLAAVCLEEDIPTVGLYSGKGVHLHQLYQPRKNPHDELTSIGNKFKTELDLETVDTQCFEPRRISKIPNTRRMDDGEFTGIWTVPLTVEEMTDATVQDLLAWSQGPRHDLPLDAALLNRSKRPEMEVYEDYLGREMVERGSREMATPIERGGDAVEIVEEYIELPCIRERVLTRNPDHMVRVNFAVLMFNYGFSKEEVHDIIRELGWTDYKPDMTRKQLESIYRNKYRDKSCAQLMTAEFCTRRENPEACEAYGWTGGNASY